MEKAGLYTLIVDGETYQSTSPITEEQIRRKLGKMAESGAFGNTGEATSRKCSECPDI